MPSQKTDRAPRRHVRVACELVTGGNVFKGVSCNISVSGIYLRATRLNDSPPLLTGGASGHIRFTLPDQLRAIEAAVQLVWVDPHDHDVGGKLVYGVGLRLIDLSPDTSDELTRFVKDFRYGVLVVSGSAADEALLRSVIADDYGLIACASGQEALARLEEQELSVVIVCDPVPDMSTMQVLESVSARLPHTHATRVVIADSIVTEADEAMINEFVSYGRIFHSLRRPLDVQRVQQILRRAVDAYAMSVENEHLNHELERVNNRLARENNYLRQRVESLKGFDKIVGESSALRASLRELELVRDSDVTVHVRGETGTGKELVARAMHFGGPRSSGAFVAQNCGGMNESLMQSTLFGHKKGAFTGADRDREGVFQMANGGTLFLDEVADLPIATQALILRALQEREIVPVGGVRPESVNVRLISATHKDLRKEVQQGRFREDLFFRLVVISVELPPLRERHGDIPLLAKNLLELLCERNGRDVAGFTVETMEALERYSWPGNIRELENELQRLVLLCERGAKIPPALLSPHIRAASVGGTLSTAAHTPESAGLCERLSAFEREILREMLSRYDGNRTLAAKALQVPRQTLNDRIKKLGLA